MRHLGELSGHTPYALQRMQSRKEQHIGRFYKSMLVMCPCLKATENKLKDMRVAYGFMDLRTSVWHEGLALRRHSTIRQMMTTPMLG